MKNKKYIILIFGRIPFGPKVLGARTHV